MSKAPLAESSGIALGLYSVYEAWKAAPQKTLEQVAELGYEGIELYGDPVCPASELREWLSAAGLQNVGWHTEWRLLQEETRGRTLDDHQRAGTQCVLLPALGGPWEIAHSQAEDSAGVWRRHAEWLNNLAGEVGRRGMRLGYHTHEHEFETRYPDGLTPWLILCRHTRPSVVLEVDTGNCLAAGRDPAVVIADVPGRALWVHVKPFSLQARWETTLGADDDASDWPAILAACGAAGTRWLVVEHE